MSGGTWDYRDRQLHWLAEDVREGRARWHDDDDAPLDMAAAREAMATALEVLGELLHELDWHFAGDSTIADEADWLTMAQERLREALVADPDVS